MLTVHQWVCRKVPDDAVSSTIIMTFIGDVLHIKYSTWHKRIRKLIFCFYSAKTSTCSNNWTRELHKNWILMCFLYLYVCVCWTLFHLKYIQVIYLEPFSYEMINCNCFFIIPLLVLILTIFSELQYMKHLVQCSILL